MAALYGAVRAEADGASGHRLWVDGRNALFRDHPDSPLSADDPLRRSGIPVWPYDPALRLEVQLVELSATDPTHAPTSALPTATASGSEATGLVDLGGDAGDGTLRTDAIGTVELPPPVVGSLVVWWLHQYGGGIFLPVRDATAGTTTYGGGRYLLDTAKGADLGSSDGRLVLDLNFLYHPSCRYDPAWTCPLAPAGNRLAVAIEAGERLS